MIVRTLDKYTEQQMLKGFRLINCMNKRVLPDIGETLRLHGKDGSIKYFVYRVKGWDRTTKERAENPATWEVTIGNRVTKMVATDGDVIFERVRQFNTKDAINYHVITA